MSFLMSPVDKLMGGVGMLSIRNAVPVAIILFSLALAGCSQRTEAARVNRFGRFTGIGVYEAGRLWPQVAAVKGQSITDTASPADDEHIIVVVDTMTGDVRQCGDLSGRCIGMNPWRPLGAGTTAPVKLEMHLSELDQPENISVEDAVPARK